jgi:hypothetical protein
MTPSYLPSYSPIKIYENTTKPLRRNTCMISSNKKNMLNPHITIVKEAVNFVKRYSRHSGVLKASEILGRTNPTGRTGPWAGQHPRAPKPA